MPPDARVERPLSREAARVPASPAGGLVRANVGLGVALANAASAVHGPERVVTW
jgi:hypothetical protein